MTTYTSNNIPSRCNLYTHKVLSQYNIQIQNFKYNFIMNILYRRKAVLLRINVSLPLKNRCRYII